MESIKTMLMGIALLLIAVLLTLFGAGTWLLYPALAIAVLGGIAVFRGYQSH